MPESLLSRIQSFFAHEPLQRTETGQSSVDERTRALSLYHYPACPYCIRVRRKIKVLNLKIELRDIIASGVYRRELKHNGGRSTVPCLRIQAADGSIQWMYESSDIIHFLTEQFGTGEKPAGYSGNPGGQPGGG